jgi:hypothetical protein
MPLISHKKVKLLPILLRGNMRIVSSDLMCSAPFYSLSLKVAREFLRVAAGASQSVKLDC